MTTLALQVPSDGRQQSEMRMHGFQNSENEKRGGGHASASNNPRQNHLLAALLPEVYDDLFPHLKLAPLPPGWVIHKPGMLLEYVYFPTTSVVSLVYIMVNGASAEIAIVGNEGLVGIMSVLGGGTTPNWAIVEATGYAYRMNGEFLRREFVRNSALQRVLLRYTQALMTQTAQIAVCNRHHSVEQQLCRWLLMRLDRLPDGELITTQEQIAHMLGVRREGITEAAGKLQSEGIIRYSRGRIAVIDRLQLESRACECYATMKEEYDRLLGGPRQAGRAA